MSKVIFVDDEKDILDHYKSVFFKNSKKSNLETIAAELFSSKDVLAKEIKNDLQGIQVLTALQGEDAVEAVQRELHSGDPIEIAFIDMRMPPGIDGKETAKRIHAIDDKIEIVIVTAYSDTQPDQLLREIGSPDKLIYLKKPFDLAEIQQLIRNLTAKYRNERVKDEFIGNVTHELKTPLSAILGFSEVLLMDIPSTSSNYENVRILHSNAVLIQSLISDLIETVNMSRSEFVIVPEETDLTSLLEDCFLSFKKIPGRPDVELIFSADRHPKVVSIDPIRFKQVIFNLLTNSMKFTPKGKIELQLNESDKNYVVTVSDTGEGISKDNLGKVFEKFYRVENSYHSIPGLGLGLHLVKEILNLHDVKFEMLSDLNEGTRFIIYIPKKGQALAS